MAEGYNLNQNFVIFNFSKSSDSFVVLILHFYKILKSFIAVGDFVKVDEAIGEIETDKV